MIYDVLDLYVLINGGGNMTQKKSPKIAVLGIDGGTWDLILPWVEKGLLPHFSRLLQEGAWGTLHSTIPPVTAPAWTSFMTGKNPGKHGLYDFIEPKPNSYKMQYTCAASRKSKILWRILSDRGRKVGVINVPMTYPPEEINGYMISGMDTPDEGCPFIYPSSLKRELWREIGEVKLDIPHLGYMRTDQKRGKVLKDLVELEKKRLDLILYLFEKHPVDIFMVVFNATDQVQHHFWHYMDSTHHQYDKKGAKKYGSAILKIYQCIDEIIRVLLRTFSQETTIILMSDHGFRPVSSRYLYLNRYLEKIGVLSVKNSGLKSRSKMFLPFVNKVDSILRSMLSPDLKRKLSKLFPWARPGLESLLALSMFDWSKTQAYAVEISATSPNIWINLQGRYPQGIVPMEEYNNIVEHIQQALYALIDPDDGSQVISRIYRREEIYEGKEVNNAPDLILSWWDGKGFTVKPSYPKASDDDSIIKQVPKSLEAGVDWSGTHKPNGMFLFYGKDTKKGKKVEDANIIDIAPTILYLLNEAIPEDMDGKVLLEILDKSSSPPRTISYQKISPDEETETLKPYSEEDEEKIRERLKRLGYLS